MHHRGVRSDGTSWAAVALALVSLASLVCIVLGAVALAVGETRPTTRATSVQQHSTSTTAFGWSGTAALRTANDIYPDGQVQSPQPVFLRLLTDVTVTADVTTSGAAPTGSHPLTLRATLADDTGWSRTWALDRTVILAGGSAHLSAPLRLSDLNSEIAWNQTATGVRSPVTLTLTVDSGQVDRPTARLAFSLSDLLFRPRGPLTTTARTTVSVPARATAVVRLDGQSVSIESLRTNGAALLGGGLIVAGAAALARRRSRRRAEPPAHARVTIPEQRAALGRTTREPARETLPL
jgi:hypothetical protein